MFKVLVLIALAIAAVNAQEEPSAAAEPYAYAYQTETHQASEQRSPDGKVTGFYTIIDPTDGRERRVEYVADENGFRAKVATNEVGTKSANSADVEVFASPPTEAQLAYQPQTQQTPQQQQRFQQQQYAYRQQMVNYQGQQQTPPFAVAQAPGVTTSTVQQQAPTASYSQFSVQQKQPVAGYGAGYGMYPGYEAGYGMYPGYEAGYQGVYGGYGANKGSYNYHLPAQYYSNYQSSRVVQPASVSSFSVGGGPSVVTGRLWAA